MARINAGRSFALRAMFGLGGPTGATAGTANQTVTENAGAMTNAGTADSGTGGHVDMTSAAAALVGATGAAGAAGATGATGVTGVTGAAGGGGTVVKLSADQALTASQVAILSTPSVPVSTAVEITAEIFLTARNAHAAAIGFTVPTGFVGVSKCLFGEVNDGTVTHSIGDQATAFTIADVKSAGQGVFTVVLHGFTDGTHAGVVSITAASDETNAAAQAKKGSFMAYQTTT